MKSGGGIMTKYDVLKIILDEKKSIDNVKGEDKLREWFWRVGFKNINVDEENKTILVEVSRPNAFISKFRKPIVNFLIYLTEQVFIKQGYKFELAKYKNDEYETLFKEYLKNNDNDITNNSNEVWI